MAKYQKNRQFSENSEGQIKRIQLIGIISDFIILAVAAYFYFIGQTQIALIAMIVALGGILAFTFVLPQSLRKRADTLKELDSLLEVTPQTLRHGELTYNWTDVIAILQVTAKNVPNENSPILVGDNYYILTDKRVDDKFTNYSPFTYNHAGFQLLQIRLSYFEKPDALTEELLQVTREKNIEFAETQDSTVGEKFIHEKYKHRN